LKKVLWRTKISRLKKFDRNCDATRPSGPKRKLHLSKRASRNSARSYSIEFAKVYAAEAARFLGSASPSQRTLTSFETPGSCMVTPYKTLPISMVLRLWVTMMN